MSVNDDVKKQDGKTAKMRVKPGEKKTDAPHLLATFEGEYLRATGKGHEQVPFEKNVRIPLKWVIDDNLTPIGLFKKFYAPKVMADLPGYSGLRLVHLTAVEAINIESAQDIPDLTLKQQLKWIADVEELATFAKRYAKEVQPSLYPHADDLRQAITEHLDDPAAFKLNQQKFADSPKAKFQKMDKELEELGY